LIKKEHNAINVLINNAGVYKREERKSVDGFEMTIAVNYISVFLLTNILLALIKNAANARIINLSSEVYKRGKVHLHKGFNTNKYNGIKSYANSKLLVTYFTKELAKKLNDTGITVNSLHPGIIGTNVFRDYPNWITNFMKLIISKPTEGAKPSIYLATANELSGVSGKYFNKIKQTQTIKLANDPV
jgi:NAD(P)-dependent dehydrogenase (short-subunit alcohol dehydrogenase family)